MTTLLNLPTNRARISLPQLTNYWVCNPSIIHTNTGFSVVYKGINYNSEQEGFVPYYSGFRVPFSDSQNYCAHISASLKVERTFFIEDRHIRSNFKAFSGIQDLRLFRWRSSVYALGAAITHKVDEARQKAFKITTMVLCELVGHYLKLVCFLPSRQPHEKNWMPWIRGNELFFIYNHHPYEVLQFTDGGLKVAVKRTESVGLENERGGSCVMPYNDMFVGVVHSRRVVADNGSTGPTKTIIYKHRLIVYDSNFGLVAVSPEFDFESNAIEFCAGLVFTKNDIIFSYGVWDNQAILLSLPKNELLEELRLGFLVDGESGGT